MSQNLSKSTQSTNERHDCEKKGKYDDDEDDDDAESKPDEVDVGVDVDVVPIC